MSTLCAIALTWIGYGDVEMHQQILLVWFRYRMMIIDHWNVWISILEYHRL